MKVPFTQYLMPDGRKRPTSIDVSEASYAQWVKLDKLGFSMGVELLSDWKMVSLTVEHRKIGLDYDIELHSNGPGMVEAVERLLGRFNPEVAQQWIANNGAESAIT